MDFKKHNTISLLTAFMLAMMFIYSCSPLDLDFTSTPAPGRTEEQSATRVPVEDYENVFIVYSMGYNDLDNFLRDDINELLTSPLMTTQRDVMLIFSHLANHYKGEYYSRWNEPTKPTLTKISRNIDGSIRRDTLKIWPDTRIGVDAQMLNEVLSYTKENFDAERYGILLSSHGSGWCPSGYLSNPSKFENSYSFSDDDPVEIRRAQAEPPLLYNLARPDEIPVKSMGAHFLSKYESIEMDIQNLAAAFPFKMDYIIFDACFMGAVEVAYELRNVTDILIASQTEILGDGMDYQTMAGYIYPYGGPDLNGFCQRFFDYYNAQSGQYRSATISMIDCSQLEELASKCKEIFSSYRAGLSNVQANRSKVQRYYRSAQSNHQWFYDFGDIIKKCSLSPEDQAEFEEILNRTILYKAATQMFMSSFYINTHSGLSMYLPITTGRDYLNNFYKTLEWNKATGLVE